MKFCFCCRVTVHVGGSVKAIYDIFYELIDFDKNNKVTLRFGNLLWCRVSKAASRTSGLLPPLQDKTKNIWDTFSGEVLVGKKDMTLCPETSLPRCFQAGVLNFKTISDSIGSTGELLIRSWIWHWCGICEWKVVFGRSWSSQKKIVVTAPTLCLSLLSTMSPNGSIRIFFEEVWEDLGFLREDWGGFTRRLWVSVWGYISVFYSTSS